MLIILSGPPAAGKSTIGEKLALAFPRSVNFSLDDIRHFVKNGYVAPWNDTEEEGQSTLATTVAIAMIKQYLAKNFVVIIDDVIDDQGVKVYKDQLDEIQAFLLLPRLKILKERDARRTPAKQMGSRVEELYREIAAKKYELLQIIDSSDQAPEETVTLIQNKVEGEDQAG